MMVRPAVARVRATLGTEVSLIPGGHRHVDIVEHDVARPTTDAPLHGQIVADSQGTAPPPDTDSEETVFTMLAARARTRAAAHLWITAGIGFIDALALMVARPSLWWVAAACLTVSAYAVWGLADRALARSAGGLPARWTPWGLRAVRVAAVAVGIAGGAATMVGFLATALGSAGRWGW
jgi:hypothetical protein